MLAAASVFGIGHIIQREVFDFLGVALIFGSMVQYCLSHQPRWFRIFDLSGFYVVSRLSYGMYLNHAYITHNVAGFILSRMPFLDRMPAVQEMVGATFLTVTAAALSLLTYCLIEHPFLQIRDVLLRRVDGSGDLLDVDETEDQPHQAQEHLA